MKRTIEIILIVLGMIVYGFFTLMGASIIWMQNNRDKAKEFFKSNEAADDAFTFEEFEEAINNIGSSGWIFTLTLLFAIVVGIVALILLKGNKYPKPAGLLLIFSAVIFTVVVGMGPGIGGVFYLIAGIVCMVRNEDHTTI